MEGLGAPQGQKSVDTDQVLLDKTQRLETRVFQTAPAGVSAYVATRQLPAGMEGVKLPEGLSTGELAFFKNKMKVRGLTEIVRKYRTMVGGHYHIDLNKVREEHGRILEKAGFKKKNSIPVSDFIVTFVREKLRRVSIDVNIDYHMGNKTADERRAAMAVLRGVSGLAAQMGVGTPDKNQQDCLESIKKGYKTRTGKEMTQQQLSDMCRAALQAGFSINAVSTFIKPKAKPGQKGESPVNTEFTIMLTTLQQMAQQVAFRLNDELRRARRAYESNKDDPKTREQYEAAKTRLKKFTGSSGAVDDLEKLGNAEKRVIDEVTLNHFRAKFALHTGNLKNVRPKPRQRAA